MQQMNTYLNHGRLDYADDIGLLSSRHEDMQEMMDKLTTTAPQIGLRLNTAKTKLKRNNYKTDNPITVITSDALEEVQDFVYMGRKSQQMKCQQNMPGIKSERLARFRYAEVHLEILAIEIENKTETVQQ